MKFSKLIEDDANFVKKIIFEDETAITETVLYNYDDRAVVCFSTQSGCPVGCVFCGTGNKFIRNLTSAEMYMQIEKALEILGEPPNKIQLMAMSMGDPMLNWDPTKDVAVNYLEKGYSFYISTIGIDDQKILFDFLLLGFKYRKFGVQFSLHSCDDKLRQKLFRNKDLKYMSIDSMLSFADTYLMRTENKVYFNYIAEGKETNEELEWLAEVMINSHLTCSVKCDKNNPKKSDPSHAIELARIVHEMSDFKVDVTVFDPVGQDTIGGGCGQLLYVQEKLNQQKTK